MLIPRFLPLALACLLATPAPADTTSLTCVVNAGRNVNARDIALNCGVGEAEVSEILAILQRIEGDAATQSVQLDRIEALVAANAQKSISDVQLVELARRISRDVSDPQTAFFELEKAVDIATRLQHEARQNPGTDAFVAEVLRRVAEKNDKADLDGGATELDTALALIKAEKQNLRQRELTLLENALTQDILRRDAVAAANRHISILELQEQRKPTVSEVLEIANDHSRFAVRFGGQIELEIAIALAGNAESLAVSDVERGAVLGSKGIFWKLSGLRGHSPDGLANSAAAYREALVFFTKSEHPLYWAQTQNNLGNALADQGTRTGGPEGAELLAQAVAAYGEALTVRTRADHPVDWAATQNNLALALTDQGTHIGGPEGAALLGQAVAAYGVALIVYTRADHPVQWAVTQNNLAIALRNQGSRTGGPEGAALLGRAVAVFREVLTVHTRADHPVNWATTQNNLGNALSQQGTRTGGPEGAELLAQAVAAYGAALIVYTRADHPAQWAMTRQNMAIAELAIANHNATPDPASHLAAALDHVDTALTVFDPEHMPYNHTKAIALRDAITAALADL